MTLSLPSSTNYDVWAANCCIFLSNRDIKNFRLTCRGIYEQVTKGIELFVYSFFMAKSAEKKKPEYESIIEKFSFIQINDLLKTLFLGEFYRFQGLYKKAMLQFEQLSCSVVESTSLCFPFVMTAKATMAMWQKKEGDAKKLVEESFKQNSNYIPTLLCRFVLLDKENPEEALKSLNQAHKQDPDNVHVRRCFIFLAFHKAQTDEEKQQAIARLVELIKCVNSAYSYHLRILLANMYTAIKQQDKADNIWTEIIGLPHVDDALVSSAVYIKMAEFCSSGKRTPQFRLQLLNNASKTASFSELCDIVDIFIKQQLWNLGNDQGVIEVCNQIIKIQQDYGPARRLRGLLLMNRINFLQQVFEDLRIVYLQDKNDNHIRALLIDLLTSGKIQEMPAFLDELLKTVSVQQEPVPEKDLGVVRTPAEQKLLSSKKLCTQYLTWNFQEKLQNVQKLREAAKELLETDSKLLGWCCLGEAAMVLSETTQMRQNFLFLGEWVESFVKSKHISSLVCHDTPPIEFYFISRYVLFVLIEEEPEYGYSILKNLQTIYSQDPMVEASLLDFAKGVTLSEFNRILLLDPHNFFVMQCLCTSFSSYKINEWIFKLLNKHLDEISIVYPENTLLLMIMAFVKNKVGNCDNKVIFDLYTQVIKKNSCPKTEIEKRYYSDALICRASLFVREKVSHYRHENLEEDLEMAYTYSQNPQLLLDTALTFRESSFHFTKNKYLIALKCACKAYMIENDLDMDIESIISELYFQGGYGILKNEEVGTFWVVDEDDDSIAADDWIMAAELADEKADAVLYATKAFKKSRKKEAYDLLIKFSLSVLE